MRIIFMGTPDFAVTTLEALYQAGHEIVLAVTQPDKPRGRKGEPQFSDVKKWAVVHDIPVFQPDRIRKPENIEELRKYPADIMVVAAYGQILPKEILDMPPYGCVNVHASLLPRYRGAAPIQWSILNGDKETGVTTMQMGVGLDDGDILEQRVVPIDPEETGGSLFDKLAIVGGQLIVQTLKDLEEGKVKAIPQDEEKATHVGMLKKSMGNLNWSRPASELHNYVRGLNPWPSAYSYLNGKMVKIWKSSCLDGNKDAVPGTILSLSDQGIEVAAGEGSLLLEEIQMEGKKRMDAKSFLLGHPLKVGELFTDER
ncbi:MAG: methionyl-tRNA formyltransferase [Lachnospiraceae bacterium]|nr:methionyl-tRNA formyltransferase [Lachnospiraceae bacterium]